MPMILKYVPLCSGDVLEIGSGLFSTPLLHWLCKGLGKNLITYENDERFFNFAQTFEDETHKVILIKDWNDIPVKQYGVVLIDHAPESRRAVDAIKFKDSEYVIMHDTEARVYGYDQVWPHFEHRFDWKDCRPWTSVVSNIKLL